MKMVHKIVLILMFSLLPFASSAEEDVYPGEPPIINESEKDIIIIDSLSNGLVIENTEKSLALLEDTLKQEENDLSFEFEDENAKKDVNMGLFPEKVGFMEKALWSKNGLFRSVGIIPDLTPEQREKELRWRRTFLTIHQTTGIATLGLMAASAYTGQQWYDGKSDSPDLHKTLVLSTIIGYSLTGIMAMITPPPSIRRSEFSTITVHKALAWLHIAGMVATPILGKAIERSSNYENAARFHQTSAYITTAIYAAAMAVIILWD